MQIGRVSTFVDWPWVGVVLIEKRRLKGPADDPIHSLLIICLYWQNINCSQNLPVEFERVEVMRTLVFCL